MGEQDETEVRVENLTFVGVGYQFLPNRLISDWEGMDRLYALIMLQQVLKDEIQLEIKARQNTPKAENALARDAQIVSNPREEHVVADQSKETEQKSQYAIRMAKWRELRPEYFERNGFPLEKFESYLVNHDPFLDGFPFRPLKGSRKT